MKPFYLLAIALCGISLLPAQDTLSFGGIYDLPGAEVRAAYVPVSPLAPLLPGVVQTNDQANHLSVRGNTPNANLWRLNGLAIVNPNHTANAGTFYDFPTLSGGGVNAISAQMLDNSGFLAGGLPVEYGYATGGTFDLRLRPGSKTRRKYQAQAGFIGFDLEGPVGKSEQTSYLVNGRYSFTGLLADMGVDFGGEEIRFADFNAHLHHKLNGGEVSAFAIRGGSSNVFRFAVDEEEEESQKDLSDIDFQSQLEVYGANLTKQLGAGELKVGASYSQTQTDRDQALREEEPFILQNIDNKSLNANVNYSFSIGNAEMTVGAEVLQQRAFFTSNILAEGNLDYLTLTSSPSINVSSPFVSYNLKGERSDLRIGLRGSAYSKDVSDFVFEPRLSYELRSGAGRFLINADRISLPPIAAFLVEANVFNSLVPVSNNFALGYGRSFGGVATMLKGYFQYTDTDYAINEDGFLSSANNFLELYIFQVPTATAATRRYGIELEAAGGRKTKGWYYRGNLSLLRAETEQADGTWTKDRYSVDYIAKVTLGREWASEDRKERKRTYGVNLALIANGGERYGEVIAPPSNAPINRQYFQPQNLSNGYVNQIQGYFRPDLRLYKTKTRSKTTTTLALDVQNVAGVCRLPATQATDN